MKCMKPSSHYRLQSVSKLLALIEPPILKVGASSSLWTNWSTTLPMLSTGLVSAHRTKLYRLKLNLTRLSSAQVTTKGTMLTSLNTTTRTRFSLNNQRQWKRSQEADLQIDLANHLSGLLGAKTNRCQRLCSTSRWDPKSSWKLEMLIRHQGPLNFDKHLTLSNHFWL